VRKYPVQLSNGKNKMAATIRNPDTKSVREMAVRKPDDPAFGWSILAGPGPLNAGTFEIQTSCPDFEWC
jgi:hypothetical protein